MGIKKRSKVSAEFSMSSLTDIIFLLLIFFMLTANFVRVDNLELPKSDSKVVAPTDVAIALRSDGKYLLNGKEMPFSSLKSAVRTEMAKVKKDKDNRTITIVAEVGVPFQRVQKVMEIAQELRLKAILATQPNS